MWGVRSALGSIELGGRAPALSNATIGVTMQEIPNFPKWIGWYYLAGYALIIAIVAAITYL